MRLVEQDARVRQRVPLAGGTDREQERARRRGLPDTPCGDVGPDRLHRVVDREHADPRSARRVDVQRDVLVGILGLEEQQLRDDDVRDGVVELAAEEDNAFAQQSRVDVEGALAPVRLLDHGWDHEPLAHGDLLVVSWQPLGCGPMVEPIGVIGN